MLEKHFFWGKSNQFSQKTEKMSHFFARRWIFFCTPPPPKSEARYAPDPNYYFSTPKIPYFLKIQILDDLCDPAYDPFSSCRQYLFYKSSYRRTVESALRKNEALSRIAHGVDSGEAVLRDVLGLSDKGGRYEGQSFFFWDFISFTSGIQKKNSGQWGRKGKIEKIFDKKRAFSLRRWPKDQT